MATKVRRRSRSVRTNHAKRRVRARVGFRVLSPPQVGRTPGISCEAVPASDVASAGMRRHVHPRNHAAESFVSFIPLFGSVALQSYRLVAVDGATSTVVSSITGGGWRSHARVPVAVTRTTAEPAARC
jgi:hypothetical protein